MHKGSKWALRRFGLPGFANMVCFCAVNEYKVLSGGNSREVAYAVLFLTIAYEMIYFLIACDRKENVMRVVIVSSLITSIAWVSSTIKDELIFNYMTPKNGIYIEKMGGYVTSLGKDLLNTDKFLAGESFWSTYASAQEVVSDKYQPSGTDYIIHVLGDEQRENYLKDFKNDDFKYAATLKETYSNWEYWIQRFGW